MQSNQSKEQRFRISQPFFSFDVKHYHEIMQCTEQPALFYEFSTNKIIDRSQNELYMTCIPDGCVGIVFIRHNAHYKMEYIGTPVSHKSLIVYPDATYFGVRLKPGMFFPSEPLSMKELANTETFVPQLSSEVETFIDTLFCAASLEERVQLFYSYLSCYDPRCFTVNDSVQHVLDLIGNSRGTIRISEIAKAVCYSERHLSRMFTDTMGYSPKLYSRIVRFQYALDMMLSHSATSVSACINNLNYADQAHFQREFKEFTGLTPRGFSQRFSCHNPL